jgi:hypothetical protein
MAFCQPAGGIEGNGGTWSKRNCVRRHGSSDRFEAFKVAKIYYLVFIFRAYRAAAALGP